MQIGSSHDCVVRFQGPISLGWEAYSSCIWRIVCLSFRPLWGRAWVSPSSAGQEDPGILHLHLALVSRPEQATR